VTREALDSAPHSAHGLAPGHVIASRYVIEEAVGEGMSGVVYAARRRPDGDRVALKVIRRHLLSDPQFSHRFEREASILTQLEGNHIARVLDVVEHDGLRVLVLEFVEGVSLDVALRSRPPEIREALEIMLQICAALGAAHAGGFVHRDLKPANVIVQGAFGGERVPMVWVVDFGLAKALQSESGDGAVLTERNVIVGTPEYMSPEQVRGDDVDRRCDIYAAGVILFEMVTGRLPFVGRNPIATMTAHLSEPVPSPRALRPDRDISPTLEAVLLRALAKSPADRYPTARAFAEALSAARAPHHVIAPATMDDASVLATSDTELELKAIIKSIPNVTPPAPVIPPARASTGHAADIQKPAPPVRAGQPARWVWIAVAIVVAAVAVVVGALFGAR
jgi:eukaryotic-like serine/threonine-protein kinase